MYKCSISININMYKHQICIKRTGYPNRAARCRTVSPVAWEQTSFLTSAGIVLRGKLDSVTDEDIEMTSSSLVFAF